MDPESQQKQNQVNMSQATVDTMTGSLEESIKETVARDLKTIITKLKFFFAFKKNDNMNLEQEIRNYELWGPFVFFLLLSLTSSLHKENMESAFTTVIMIIVLGCFVLTINSKLLQTNVSFLQGISAIGYSMFPINVAGLFNCLFSFLPNFLKFSVGLGCAVFSIMCGFRVMECLAPKDKVYLVSFPLVIFYLSLCWFVVGC